MLKSTSLSALAALVAAMCVYAGPAQGGERQAVKVQVSGEKLDSGLGELPHYSRWLDMSGKTLVGEKLDSGLGDLPHYSRWADARGNTPMAQRAAPVLISRAK